MDELHISLIKHKNTDEHCLIVNIEPFRGRDIREEYKLVFACNVQLPTLISRVISESIFESALISSSGQYHFTKNGITTLYPK